jgi:hypothetical protein
MAEEAAKVAFGQQARSHKQRLSCFGAQKPAPVAKWRRLI